MSVAMKATTGLLTVVDKVTSRPILDGDHFLDTLDPGRKPATAPAGVRRAGTVTAGQGATPDWYRFEPKNRVLSREIVYLPGGGYVNPLIAPQWEIVQRVGIAARSSVTIVNYPVAPEHSAEDTLRVVDKVYDSVRARATTVVVMGDSAGAHAALTLAGRRKHSGDGPDAVVAISPWIDLMLSNPAAQRRQHLDPLLGIEGLRVSAQSWLRNSDPLDPAVNIGTMEREGLPPLLIAQGARDLFYDDTLDFAAAAAASGVHVELMTAPDGFHVYPAAWWTSEARDFFRSAGSFVGRIAAGAQTSAARNA